MQRCSSEARVRDCPPHRPEEQWLCCFARLQRDIPKVPTLNRKKEQSTICLTHAPGVQDVKVPAVLLYRHRLGKNNNVEKTKEVERTVFVFMVC